MSDMNMNEALEITQRRKYSNQNDNTAFSVIRINNKQIKRLGKRNDWVTITNFDYMADKSQPEIKGVIYRQIQGSGSSDLPLNACEFDYEGVVCLGLAKLPKNTDGYYPCSLRIEKTNSLSGLWLAHWNHPNTGHRVQMRYNMIGLSLGFIGLALGVIGFLH